jgi:hypothetical protein
MYIRLDLLLTAVGFPPGGSVQYKSTKHTKTRQRRKTIQKQGTEKIKSSNTDKKRT